MARDRLLRFLLLGRQCCSSKIFVSPKQDSVRFSSLLLPYTRTHTLITGVVENYNGCLSSLRRFSSSPELVSEPPRDASDRSALLYEVFAEPWRSDDEIKQDLSHRNLSITHDLILRFLQSSQTQPDVARRVFDWVSGSHVEKLSSKSYNLMLGILGSSAPAEDVWDMIGFMSKKGYGVSKDVYLKLFEKFEEGGQNDDLEKLKNLYASGSMRFRNGDESQDDALSRKISKLIRKEVWGDHVEKQLKDLNVEFSTDLVVKVIDSLEMDPNKSLIFFRWLQESGSFEHDQRSYIAAARILSKEDHSQKFWRLVNEMRNAGHELDKENYVHLLEHFVKRKRMKDAVDLYEFAMGGRVKPSVHDCTFLLKKIVISNELDMELFLKVIRCFKENGNSLTDANLNAVVKSLTSAGRMTECNRIVAAMKETGYHPGSSVQCKIAYKLSRGGETGEVLQFAENMGDSRHLSDHRTWLAIVEGYCFSKNVDAACSSLREMVDKVGAVGSGRALDLVIDFYCRDDRPLDGWNFLLEMVKEKGLTPWHTTYKKLTSKLLSKKLYQEALDVMSVMKSQGYPPYLDCFLKYLSKKGSTDDAIEFTRAMTSKRSPATSVYLQLFDAYLNAGRGSETHDLLSKCPRYIRNHADVLNLFASRESDINRTLPVTA